MIHALKTNGIRRSSQVAKKPLGRWGEISLPGGKSCPLLDAKELPRRFGEEILCREAKTPHADLFEGAVSNLEPPVPVRTTTNPAYSVHTSSISCYYNKLRGLT